MIFVGGVIGFVSIAFLGMLLNMYGVIQNKLWIAMALVVYVLGYAALLIYLGISKRIAETSGTGTAATKPPNFVGLGVSILMIGILLTGFMFMWNRTENIRRQAAKTVAFQDARLTLLSQKLGTEIYDICAQRRENAEIYVTEMMKQDTQSLENLLVNGRMKGGVADFAAASSVVNTKHAQNLNYIYTVCSEYDKLVDAKLGSSSGWFSFLNMDEFDQLNLGKKIFYMIVILFFVAGIVQILGSPFTPKKGETIRTGVGYLALAIFLFLLSPMIFSTFGLRDDSSPRRGVVEVQASSAGTTTTPVRYVKPDPKPNPEIITVHIDAKEFSLEHPWVDTNVKINGPVRVTITNYTLRNAGEAVPCSPEGCLIAPPGNRVFNEELYMAVLLQDNLVWKGEAVDLTPLLIGSRTLKVSVNQLVDARLWANMVGGFTLVITPI
jgi:hypothetical protein